MFQTDEQIQIEYIEVNEKDIEVGFDINEKIGIPFSIPPHS